MIPLIQDEQAHWQFKAVLLMVYQSVFWRFSWPLIRCIVALLLISRKRPMRNFGSWRLAP